MDFDVSKVNIDFEALKASTEKLLRMPYSARQFRAVVEKAMEQAKLDKAAEEQRIAEDTAIETSEDIPEQEAPETDAELQEMNGDLLKLNEEFVAEIEKLTAQVENYRSEAEKAQSVLAKERTDWHRQKKSYEGELWRLQKDNDELRALLESCDEQGEAEQETYEEGEAALPTVLPSLPESRIVFVGGHPNMVNKVKAIYPNWVYVDGDHSPEKATQFDKVIACFIAYKHIGHPLWASMMAAARSYDVPIFYVQYTNMERMLLDMRRSYAAIAQFRADEGIDDSDVVPASPEETQGEEKSIWEKQEEARRAAKEKSKKQRERKKAREQRETSEAQLEIEARAEEAAREERKRWAEERQKRAKELRKRQAEARERERLWKEEQARKAAELKLKREAERLAKLEEEKKRQAEYEERRKVWAAERREKRASAAAAVQAALQNAPNLVPNPKPEQLPTAVITYDSPVKERVQTGPATPRTRILPPTKAVEPVTKAEPAPVVLAPKKPKKVKMEPCSVRWSDLL